MYTIKIINKDKGEVVFSREGVEEYTYNKGLLNELIMTTRLTKVYTTIRDNEILFIKKG